MYNYPIKSVNSSQNSMTEKTQKNSNMSQTVIILLCIALIGISFFAGSLWTKVKNMESGAKVSAGNTKQDEQPSQDFVQPSAKIPTKVTLTQTAQNQGLDIEAFNNCLNSNKFQNKVNSHLNLGEKIGITGTPGNILLNTSTGKSLKLAGAVPYSMLKDSIQKLLSDDQALETEVISDLKVESDDHILGSANAQIILFEYSDFDCPFCARFHPTAKQMIDEFKDQTSWVYRHFPLQQLHPEAQLKAEASECAFEQGGNDAFWKFTDSLYEDSN